MAQQTTYKPLDIQDKAEGSPVYGEDSEHYLPDPHKYPMFINEMEKVNPAAETGLVSAVQLDSEGKDDEDSQDASLTKAETQPPNHNHTTEKAQAAANAKTEAETTPAVFIVEDNAELAEIIQATLERMKISTAHESHGTKALERMKALNPDVVLLDIGLPDMTGWNIMDMLKEYKQQGGNMPKIIIITAYDDPANRLVGKLQGVHSYLIKPFTADEIERVVTQAINNGGDVAAK